MYGVKYNQYKQQMHYRKPENNVINKIVMCYTTARANFRIFSKADINFRTTLTIQNNSKISLISGQLGPLISALTKQATANII